MSIAEYCKTYTVKIETEFGYGTGCLFQPSTEKYTYVLTAKHLFQNNDKTETQTEINNNVKIVKSIDNEELTPLDLYHHEELDLSIVKVGLANGLGDLIYSFQIPQHPAEVALFGYPKIRDEQTSASAVEYKFLAENKVQIYRPEDRKVEIEPKQYQNHGSIIGFSGCGVFETKSNSIRLVGIEVSMADDYDDAEGRMLFISLKEFHSIIDHNNLAELTPLCKTNFKYVVNKSFDKYPNALKITKSILQDLATESIVDYITPKDILNIIDIGKALINDNCRSYLDHIYFWTVWLEFLIINKFVINKAPEETNEEWLIKIYNDQHFVFIETDDWTDKLEEIIDFWREKLEENYSTLIISCYPDTTPIKTTIPKEAFVERINRVSITDVINNNGINNISDGIDSINYRLMHFHQFTKKIAEDISEFGKEKQEIILEIKNIIESVYNDN